MKRSFIAVVAAAVWSAGTSTAQGQCAAPVSIAVVTTGTYTTNCVTDPVTSRWNVTVTINGPVTANSTVTIRGANTLMLGRVTIQNNSAIDCRLNILGSGFDQRIGGVGYIDKGTGGEQSVLLLQLITVGDVGYDRPAGAAIRTDMIANLSVGGSVLGDLVSVSPGRSMANVYIQGDLAGGISLGANSSLDSIWIGGALGLPSEAPVPVSVSGNIGSITAASINADITTLANGAAGTVHLVETTAGPFKGSMQFHRLNSVAGAPNTPRISIAGDLNASLTLTRDIRGPITVSGSFPAARTVNGQSVPNVISATTGVFDTPTGDPTATIFVGGEFAGSMVLGQPITTGLGSLNRPLIVGGAFTGSLQTVKDIDANIAVSGVMSGRINCEGDLRAGKGLTCAAPMTPSGMVSIGGSLRGGIELPTGGLQGQVIINARNAGGVWTGPITLGGASAFVGGPQYSGESGSVGGGAVGLAPFHAFLSDCVPTHNAPGANGFAVDTAFDNAAMTPVVVRMYGPVQPQAGVALQNAVIVEQNVGGTWTDRTGYFVVGMLTGGSGGAASSRSLTLSGSDAGTPPAGQYRVRPTNLVCAGVAGSPPVVWSQPYLFRIESDCDGNGQADREQIAANAGLDQNANGVLDSCEGGSPNLCPCDQNNSGALTIQDLFDFLSDYFGNRPAADYNQSGFVSLQDLFDFLGCFFNPPVDC